MSELVSEESDGGIAEQALPRDLRFAEVDQQMQQRESRQCQMRSRSHNGARNEKAENDDGAEIVSQPVHKIGERFAALFAFDELVRLKNEVSCQVPEIN